LPRFPGIIKGTSAGQELVVGLLVQFETTLSRLSLNTALSAVLQRDIVYSRENTTVWYGKGGTESLQSRGGTKAHYRGGAK
jgi:hypothetical protein